METKNVSVLIEPISELIKERKYASLKDLFATMNAIDIAAIFNELETEQIPIVFRLLPKELAAETFVEMDDDQQELLIKSFSDTELKEIVDELYVDDAADIVEEMPANVVKRILSQADPEMRRMINEILKYPEDSAGSIMTTEYVSLRPKMTVDEAIRRIRRTGLDKETIYTCYVTLDNRTLIGMISLKDLLLADENEIIEDIMDSNVIGVNTNDDQEYVANQLSKYDLIAIPVVDGEGRLVGIVTADDAFDVLKEETTEDIEKMAAIMPSDDKPYLRKGVFEIAKQRIPWLLLLMISATFTGMIISKFEEKLSALSILIGFIPMLMDTGGNSGSQASVTVIRALSLGELKFKDILRVIWKEIRVACVCGIALSAVGFLKFMVIDRLYDTAAQPQGMTVALVLCITIFMVVIIAKTIGCILPILAQACHLDPAVMASPFITTIVDALALLIYFATATALLKF